MEARKYDPQYTIRDWEGWEGKWELIDGIPVSMSPTPLMDHQYIVANLTTLFSLALKKCKKCRVFASLDWIVDDENVFEPDLLIVCKEDGNWKEQKLTTPPALVVEVLSASTRRKDLTIKRDKYAASGIRYYLIADPDNQNILLLQKWDEQYLEMYQGKGDMVEIDLGSCQIQVDLAEAW